MQKGFDFVENESKTSTRQNYKSRAQTAVLRQGPTHDGTREPKDNATPRPITPHIAARTNRKTTHPLPQKDPHRPPCRAARG